MSEDTKELTRKKGSALTNFIAGGVGGICSVVVGHPLDLVKVRMQTAAAGTASSQGVFVSLANTARKEGIRGLYRGVQAPILAVTPLFAISFWGYDIGQTLIAWMHQNPNHQHTIQDMCWAGAFSALPTTLITAPTERIKCVMQTSHQNNQSMLNFAKKIYSEGGVRSLFRGTGVTLLRDAPGCAVYFGVYEFVKRAISRTQGLDATQLSPLAILTAGGMAGMSMWAVVMPIDTLKSRYQAAPEGYYRNFYHVYSYLVETEGYGALIRGIRPAMIRAFPANAATFMGVEVARKALSYVMD